LCDKKRLYYRQTDRRHTDGRATANSEREREFTLDNKKNPQDENIMSAAATLGGHN